MTGITKLHEVEIFSLVVAVQTEIDQTSSVFKSNCTFWVDRVIGVLINSTALTCLTGLLAG